MTASTTLALSTTNLRKSYGRQVALAGLDLEVPSGVVYGFLGPNGAGKTTTMRLLTGLIRPDSGSISVLGQSFDESKHTILYDVGALIESPSLYPHLSARDNLIVFGATGRRVGRARVEELLDLVGLRDRAGDRVSHYSMGMRQRLGIAVALLNDPKLLLLDEPANGLDPAGIVAMRDMLTALAVQGKTVFISSHLLAEVQVMADVVGIIANGKLVREGPLKELLAMQGVVNVRVRPDLVDGAVKTLSAMAKTERLTETDRDEGWLSVHVAGERAEEVNRTLAGAGIYASGLESGSDLEMLFLQLTGGQGAANGEGTFVGLAADNAATAGKGTAA